MDADQRRSDVTALWLRRPVAQRTANDVARFLHWLAQYRPELLGPRTAGDPVRLLKADLGRHVLRATDDGSH